MADYKKSPLTIKILVMVLLALVIGAGALLSGCTSTIGEGYTSKMVERSELHMPRYKALIEQATTEQLEDITGKPRGTYKDASPTTIAALRQALLREIDAWQELMKAAHEAVRQKPPGSEGGASGNDK